MAGRSITVDFLGNSRDLTNAVDQAESRTKRFGSTMGKVGKAVAGGLAVGVLAGAAGLVKLTQGAIEDEAAQKKLAQTLKSAAGATDQQVSSLEDWISAQGTALGITDDELRPALGKLVTATGDVTKAQKLAKLAMDISAGSGKSLESVSQALAKAQGGSVGGLAKYGIATKNAAGETKSLSQIQGELAQKFKGQAQTAADTTAGKMQRLKVILAEAGETIGAKLIPIVTKMADWFLKKGLPAISAFGAYLQEKLPPIFERVKEVVTRVFNQIGPPIKQAFEDIKVIVTDAVSIVRSLWKRFGSTIMEYTRNAFTNAKNIIQGVFKIIRGIFKVVSSLLKGDWKGVWDGIKTITKGAGQALKGIVNQLFNLIKTAFKLAWKAITGIVSGAWSGIKDLARNGFNAVLDYIRGVPARIAGLGPKFLQTGKDLIGQFVAGLKGAAGLVSDIAGNIWNAVKGLLNDAIDKINGALEFEISLPGPNIHVNPPNVPHLYKGGVVKGSRGGTLVVAGDRGHDEAIVPLSGPNAPRLGAMGAGGGNTYITINGALDPVAVSKQIERVLMIGGRSRTGPYQFKTI